MRLTIRISGREIFGAEIAIPGLQINGDGRTGALWIDNTSGGFEIAEELSEPEEDYYTISPDDPEGFGFRRA